MIENQKTREIVLPTQGGMEKFSTDDLYYVEVSGHYLSYHAKDGVFRKSRCLNKRRKSEKRRGKNVCIKTETAI